ncbi:MAG TPA: PA2779 family protein [Acidobacteriaceae bacterium]|nr:PA2779 family protein [Acidobacteriaceae bacterium]
MKKISTPAICCTAALLFATVAAPQGIAAQNHVVSPAQMRRDLSASSAARQRNEDQLKGFLSSSEAQKAMKSADVNPQEVTQAVSQLNNEELARLAARSAAAQKDFAAGNIDNHDLLVILVCIAVLILVIVAVH